MGMPTLSVQARSTSETPRNLRAKNTVPCVVYGNEMKNTAIQCDYNQLFKVYVKAGASTLIELDVEGKKVPSLVHDIEFDPISGRIAHVDFYAVNMKKKIEAKVPVRITGVSPAVKEEAGVLVIVRDHFTVHCLPADLPHDIEVNIDSLKAFRDTVLAGAVTLPPGVTIEESPEEVVVTVQEPRKEEVVEPVVAEGAVEGAAPVEGAEAAAIGAKPAAEAKPAAGAKAPSKKE